MFNTLWIAVKDGDPRGLALYHRHYSYRPYKDGRQPRLFCGPGEKLVLLTQDCRALWVWRKFRSADGQQGVNCAVFRNEGACYRGIPIPSSTLVATAMVWARVRWPGQRLYTYVHPSKVASANPGYCFKLAGWRFCGVTKDRGLHILEAADV